MTTGVLQLGSRQVGPLVPAFEGWSRPGRENRHRREQRNAASQLLDSPGFSRRAAGAAPRQAWQRPLTLPIGSTTQPDDAYPWPQSPQSGGKVRGGSRRMTPPMMDRKARVEADVIFFRSPIKRLIDCRGLVEQLIDRVETRVGRVGACAYAGRHIPKVLFDTSVWACHPGRPAAAERPWWTVEDVSGRRQEGVIRDTTSIGGLAELLDYKDGPLRGRGNVAGSNTRNSDRSHECVFASGPVW